MQLSPLHPAREVDGEGFSAGRRHPGKGAWDAVVVLAFGTGISNAFLAVKAAKFSAAHDCPIICQREVFCYLDADHGSPMPVVLSGMKGPTLTPTRRWSKQKQYEQRRWSKILLIAHPDHQSRALKVAHKLGLDVEVAEIEKVPYDPSSSQWWTRNRLLFRLWDLGAGFYYFIRGFV
jgi:hypothetical protein